MKILPWRKVPTNLHMDPRIWGLSCEAFRLVSCLLFLPDGMQVTSDYALWNARVTQSALDEALAAGVLSISATGILELAEFAVAPTVKTSTERVQRYRARQRSQTLQEPLLSLTISETTNAPTNTPVRQNSASPAEDVSPDPAPVVPAVELQADPIKGLIFPDAVTASERSAMLPALAGCPDQAQAVLYELAGCLEGGRVIGNRIGWVRALTQRVAQGTFVPEVGIPIAVRRNVPVAYPMRRIDPPTPPIEESLANGPDAQDDHGANPPTAFCQGGVMVHPGRGCQVDQAVAGVKG
ncbi:MAG: hypothetical protein H7834_16370 [Magnetococcus sp. YQC-9]